MNGADLFHTGLVVDDFDRTLAGLSELFGYDWCDEMSVPQTVELPGGDHTEVVLSFVYSKTVPHLEVIRTVAGTLWTPAEGSGVHHLGYWSDDIAGDGERLAAQGFEPEATGRLPDGGALWAYHRSPGGPRVELVSRAVRPFMEKYWSAGP